MLLKELFTYLNKYVLLIFFKNLSEKAKNQKMMLSKELFT